MLKNLLARRYGSLHDFSKVVARWCDISKATGVHPDTIRKAILLYHARGNRYLECTAKNFALGRPRFITPSLERELVTKETLYEMRFLSLQRRTVLIQREYGISVAKGTLAALYKRNGIKYLQAKKAKRVTTAHEARLRYERTQFAKRLHTLQEQSGHMICYLDETTF